MSARYAPEKGELDVVVSDSPTEAAVPDHPAERPHSQPPGEPRSRGEEYAYLRQRVEGNWTQDRFEAPRGDLGRFNSERAGLPAMSADAADEYIERNRATRPWLAMTDAATPEARRIIAAVDAGNGHAQIRHEGWVTEEANMRRVTHREDPAQLDLAKRAASIDGLKTDDQHHRCRTTATRIADPNAFAVAFARGVQHPKVREALDRALASGANPSEVTISIADLLGPDGHRHCTGWRLESVAGSMKDAVSNRDSWITARAEDRTPDMPEPRVRVVPTFEGGEIVFAFSRNESEQRYEIATMFPRPAQQ